MPAPIHDPDDSQPFRGDPSRNHRVYVPAVWAPAGGGSGHPKLSGGYETDIRTGEIIGRGLNRVDHRYEQPLSTILANRQARAFTEAGQTVVLLGAFSLYELRTRTGNNYDVSGSLLTCDCPDWWRIDQSGYGIVRCKHIYLAMLFTSNPSLLLATGVSCSYVAEQIGCDERTVEELCANGTLAAIKVHNVWVIDGTVSAPAITEYKSRIVSFPNATGGEIIT